MPSWIGPWEVFLSLGFLVPAVVSVFYLLTLQRALERCSPANRTMVPGLVWLGLVPLFGVAWHFVIVVALGRSLETERRSRGLSTPSRPGRSLGLAMAVLEALACTLLLLGWGAGLRYVALEVASYDLVRVLLLLSFVLGVAWFVVWILYWVKVYMYSSELDVHHRWAGWEPASRQGEGHYCWSCGAWAGPGAFCTRCGAPQDRPHPTSRQPQSEDCPSAPDAPWG
jgi:hypothetical protein